MSCIVLQTPTGPVKIVPNSNLDQARTRGGQWLLGVQTLQDLLSMSNWAARQNITFSTVDVPSSLYDKLCAEAVRSVASTKCECGAEKCRSNIHSSWCPKAK
jgi:hypothetical protein